ncbi:galactose-1-epimerase [Shewanella sp. OPT22]|nr:galactose-1-epimerase [Shewanella sp. OPT22]
MVTIKVLEPWNDPRGGEIDRVRIDNGIIAMEVLSLGGIIKSLWVAGKSGDRQNIVLGCDSAQGYLEQNAHLGAIAGRFANRIANGTISKDGERYQLDINHADLCLHGGSEGFNRKNWQMGSLSDGVRLTLHSPDGDMGFPGNCHVQLDYRLVGNNLFVEVQADTDKVCPINLTQHSYFNLDGSESVLEHELQTDCEQYLATDENSIPTSKASVCNTVLDFRQPKALTDVVLDNALRQTQGVDHCYLMTPNEGRELQRFGQIVSQKAGLSMTLYTNQPGVQVYTSNFLAGTIGKKNQSLKQHQAVCLEPQLLPDSPNQSELLGKGWTEPDEIYHHISRYQFDAQSSE